MKIGLIGAGLMGHGMAINILAAGHELHVVAHRNREPIEDLVSRGALEAASPATLGALVDVVVLCVTGTPCCTEGYRRAHPGAQARHAGH